MKFKKIYLFFLPFLFAFSCNEKEDQIINDYESKLTGEWIWVNSIYKNTMSGIPFILTPDSVGFAVKQIFLNDGSFHVYKNELIESSGIYWLETVDQTDEDDEPKIRLYTQKDSFVDFTELTIHEDSLFLDNSAADGTVKLFLKRTQDL